MLRLLLAIGLALVIATSADAATPGTRTYDGGGNNVTHPAWGQAGTPYRRTTPAAYRDGRSAMLPGPNARYLSNRVFNDGGQNLFSENGVSQWVWAWGQF